MHPKQRNLGRRAIIMLFLLPLVTVSLLFSISGFCIASPTDGAVTTGTGSISSTGNTTTVTQTSDKLAINWQSFNVASGETVNFVQPSSTAIALNRVIGTDPSAIYGTLSANGKVFLINPNGVLFGSTAQVNVGGLVASTLNLADSDFLSGKYTFQKGGGAGSVVNQGSITATNEAVLVGSKVANEGVVAAKVTGLMAGDKVSLDFSGDSLLNVTVDTAAAGASVANSGSITAPGGLVVMSTGTKDALLSTVVNNTGIIRAQTVSSENGEIKLIGSTVNVDGTLDASAPNGGNGGFIDTSGTKVNIAPAAVVTTLAPAGKTGTWLIDPNGYTIAVTGGDTTGAALSSRLADTSIEIQSTSGNGADGNINVNDTVSWSANELKLTATNDVNINAVMTASGTSSLNLNPLSGQVNAGFNPDGTFKGRVDFPGRAGSGFLTIKGNSYTVINSLGSAGSTTRADLQGINGNLAGYYALGTNIDASTTSGWNGGQGFTPISNTDIDPAQDFTGGIDGLGHTIGGLTINRTDGSTVGLIEFSSGSVRNLGLTAVNINANGITGGLVAANGGTIANCYVSGTVAGGGHIFMVDESFGTRSVILQSVGGLVGLNQGGLITNSHSSGAVNGNYSVGGLVGWNEAKCTITNSYSSSAVEVREDAGQIIPDGSGVYRAPAASAGGLVGINSGTIADSYSSGSVTGLEKNSVGGLVGFSAATITNCYSSATVSDTVLGSTTGGLVGSVSNPFITNCYSTGAVSGNHNSGGLVGKLYYVKRFNDYTISGFWDTSANPDLDGIGYNPEGWSVAVTGLDATGMKTAANFSGWDAAHWRIYDGQSCPLLKCFLTPLTITANNVSRTYDGTSHGNNNGVNYSATPSGLPLGSPTYDSASQNEVNAGTYDIIPAGFYSISQQGYDISYAPGTLTINRRPVTVTPDAGQRRVYDGTTETPTLTYSTPPPTATTGLVTGGLSGVLTRDAGKDATSYAILQGTVTNANNANYDISFTSGVNFTIDQRPVTVTPNAGQHRVYDGTTETPTLTYRTTPPTATTGLVTGESLSGVLTRDAGKDAASYAIFQGTVTNTNNANYDISFASGVNFAITPASLTVTANNASRYTGQANPAFSATYSGFVNGESTSVLTGSLIFTTPATANSPVGSYAITPGGLSSSSGNYSIGYGGGVLTILPNPTYTGDLGGGNGGSGFGFGGNGFDVMSAQISRNLLDISGGGINTGGNPLETDQD